MPSAGEIPVERYQRQMLLPQVGRGGQERLGRARVGVLGVGALGSVASDLLVRAGVGFVRVIDRDVVELSNLQRQVLYGEEDVGKAKVEAAVGRLRAVNSLVSVEGVASDVHSGNISEVLGGMDVVIDCTDNAGTRYLLNDFAVKVGMPWVYGGGVGSTGRVAAFAPARGSACLRCVFRQPPGLGELATCDTAGVFGAVTSTVGALQVQLGLRLLLEEGWVPGELFNLEFWPVGMRAIGVDRDGECPCCVGKGFQFSEAQPPGAVSLCGRNTVQVVGSGRVALAEVAKRWRAVGEVVETAFLVRMVVGDARVRQVTLFGDGRLLVEGREGTPTEGEARGVYARYVGA